jgi:hypothetical protein
VKLRLFPQLMEVSKEEDKPPINATSDFIFLLLISFWLKYWGQFVHLLTKIILGNIMLGIPARYVTKVILGNIYLPIYVTYSKVH